MRVCSPNRVSAAVPTPGPPSPLCPYAWSPVTSVWHAGPGRGHVGSTSGAPSHGRILTSKLAFSDPVAKVMAWNARSRTAVGPREVGACDEETAGRWWGYGGDMAVRWR